MFALKNKIPLFLMLASACVIMFTNSCKKEPRGTVKDIMVGNWQLATVYRTTTLAGVQITDTLNTTCDTTQVFTFNTDGTCTYTNFNCDPTQLKSSGHWSLSSDQHYLYSDMACIDTATKAKYQPFANTEINTAGLYSLVLRTGDIGRYYPSNDTVVVIRYGFVRQKTP